MLKNFIRVFGGDPNKRTIEKYTKTVDEINALEPAYEVLSDDALRAKTDELRARLAEELEGIGDKNVADEKARQKAEQEVLFDILPEAFAAVREASKRTTGMRHFDVQLIGGITLHLGQIAEMRTGEGKTLVATLPIYLNALTGRGVHLITVNDYLARRDARWMGQIYHRLGLSIGVLQMASRTENGQKAFIVDFERESPFEDQHHLRLVNRKEAYDADITYGTNSEFGFDYLRDNMGYSLDRRVQHGHYYAIVDEVDNVLIDEARTPLIISGPASDDVQEYYRMAKVVAQLRPEDIEISERDRNVVLTEIGEIHIEELLGETLRDPERPEDVTPQQARLAGYVEQAMRAQYLYHRNKEYLVQAGKVIIVDEFTGRLMPGRRWSDGLHQAVEAKEGVKVEPEDVTYATITIQNYFRMYQKLAGMSGTAITESEEFDKIYKLAVLPIPTNLENQAARQNAALVEVQARDEENYKYSYYARKDDPTKAAVFFRRKDYPDIIFRTAEAKFRAISLEILRNYALGRPVLVGTTSVDLSEKLSNRLKAEPLRKLAQVQLIRDTWFTKNNKEQDGMKIPDLVPLDEAIDKLDISMMRKMARDLEMPFLPDDPANLERLLTLLNLPSTAKERLVSTFQAGVPHEVLNARKHTEESQIIARAGAFGSVTIATNMAGRGVDIKLGGELPEENLAVINRVLLKAGHENAFDMRMEQRRQALKQMNSEEWGVNEEVVRQFLQQMDDMETVKALGGLHVIGSERHEARRIDNQLRGRAARQGDPGSSRFYLSLQDDLMLRFGGQQVEGVMKRIQVDESLPMEFNIVGRLVEGSQTRVEGANFDIRKHLLEYDDVLNSQRAAIYGQRDRVFVKDDLHDDVTEMVQTEIKRRVPEALADPEGPWKLLAWLEAVQPTRMVGKTVSPSYAVKLIVQQLQKKPAANRQQLMVALLDVAENVLESESEHIQNAVNEQITQAQTRLKEQLREREDDLDMFLEGLRDPEGERPSGPRGMSEAVSGVLRSPVRLSPEVIRLIEEDQRQAKRALMPELVTATNQQNARRLLWAVIMRLGENITLNTTEWNDLTWDEICDQIEAAAEDTLERRRERLAGKDGAIQHDLEPLLAKLPAAGGYTDAMLVDLLMHMSTGARGAFDKRTHRRITVVTTRLNYAYYVARLIAQRDSADLAADVMSHLEEAQNALRIVLGESEWARLSANTPASLDERTQTGLRQALGDVAYDQVAAHPLSALGEDKRAIVIEELGRRILTEAYRQLLLGVITELWVDYLTQMEALRISISLESYAQRDPLVQYKSQAYELYQTLLTNTRIGVISRMFSVRARQTATVQEAAEQATAPESAPAELAATVSEETTAADGDEDSSPASQSTGGGKRRRRRR
jgi:preprotein translocase subunit SecA